MALFDQDGRLVDRQSALSDAVTGLCRSLALPSTANRRLRTELADRATAGDFARLRDVFDLEASAADLWQAYVMGAAVAASAATTRPRSCGVRPGAAPRPWSAPTRSG
ncbi:hypothetical protein ACIPSH_40215 [Streptomyces iakyrus]|uniref:hypothetical protein n=1 Tax=Streptomyces iakyrus TaxID=68219 RepID=UPI0038043B5B